jgi:hypothetical protein
MGNHLAKDTFRESCALAPALATLAALVDHLLMSARDEVYLRDLSDLYRPVPS